MEEQTPTLVDEANKAAERLEKANERTAELIRQQENILAKQALGGRSVIPDKPTEKPSESPIDYARKALEGKV